MRRIVVLMSVKTLIWPLAASILGPKQSDKVMGPCYSLEQCVRGEQSQQEEEEHRTGVAVVVTYCAAVVLGLPVLYCAAVVLRLRRAVLLLY